jgi:amino acid transporter
MESKDNQPLIAAAGGITNSSDTVSIATTGSPPVAASSIATGGTGGSGGDDEPLLSVNVQQLTLSAEPKEERKGASLGQLYATAICGNDITASIFYSCGLVTYAAGQWAPLCFLLVAMVLFAYRYVYEEVGSALPLNGGSYSLMLNTVSRKEAAAVTASLTLLSYVATAVVCAVSAMEYLWVLTPTVPVYPGAACILGLFALLALLGVKESAKVALFIFTIHIITLTVLVLACAEWIYHADWATYRHNILVGDPTSDVAKKIFYGFGLSLLGITGFETSANYIEEQAPGVYPKTLRNVVWGLTSVLLFVYSSSMILFII